MARVLDRALVCTKDRVSGGNNCASCSIWRLMVWENGGFEKSIHEGGRLGPNRSTIAGKYYGGKHPCTVKDNYPLCGDWA